MSGLVFNLGFMFGKFMNVFTPVKPVIVLNSRYDREVEDAAPVVTVQSPDDIDDVIENNGAAARFEQSLTKVQELTDIGNVTMSLYPNTGRVKSTLTILNKDLAKRVGFDVLKLEPMQLNDYRESGVPFSDYARMKVVNVVERLLNERLAGSKPTKQSKTRAKAVPAEAMPEVEVPVVAKQEAASVTKAPVKPDNVPLKRAVDADRPVYIGQFVESGYAVRSNKGGKDAKPGSKDSRSFSQYYVDYLDQNLGYKKNRVWGVDLERALKDADVSKGDMIKITYLGSVPVEIVEHGQSKMVNRKSYEIKKTS